MENSPSKNALQEEFLRALIAYICKHGGTMQSRKLKHRFSSRNMDVILRDKRFFVIAQTDADSEENVTVHTELELCADHCSRQGCLFKDCGKLHACKYYISGGTCPSNSVASERQKDGKSGKHSSPTTQGTCKYGHDIHSQHNAPLLKLHLLDQLLLDKFRIVFKLNRSFSNTPQICKFYNKGGDICKKGDGCPYLHICQHYVKDDCRYGEGCKRIHDISSSQPKGILTKVGFDMRNPVEVLKHLKAANFSGEESSDGSDSESRDNSRSASGSGENVAKLEVRQICKYYNMGESGCKFGDTCKNLHVCRHFANGDCSFGEKCKRSHNIPSSFRKHPNNDDEGSRSGRSGVGDGSSSNDSDYELEDPAKSSARKIVGVKYKKAQAVDVTAASAPKHNEKVKRAENVWRRTSSESQTALDSESATKVCMFNLRGRCFYGSRCYSKHSEGPYQWQFKRSKDSQWTDFSDVTNVELEINYCDPSKDCCFSKLDDSQEIFKADFVRMQMSSKEGINNIRRLSTPSSVENLGNFYKFTTVWKWYWQDDKQTWIMYGPKSGITPKDLEKLFLSNPTSPDIAFQSPSFRYNLNFSTKLQTNLLTGKKRSVQRRPKLLYKGRKPLESYTADDIDDSLVSSASSKSTFPDYWDKNFSSDSPYYKEIVLSKDSSEFQKVERLFLESMPQSKITEMKRIQNVELWDVYFRKQTWMTRSSQATTSGHKVKESSDVTVVGKSTPSEGTFLFHGTEQRHIEGICRQGFDWRLTGMSAGARFGKGSYFAKKASLSTHYTKGAKSLFVVEVLVGDYTVGRPEYVRPPPKNPLDPHQLFDSCVDSLSKPEHFVIFNSDQAYPAYLISFV